MKKLLLVLVMCMITLPSHAVINRFTKEIGDACMYKIKVGASMKGILNCYCQASYNENVWRTGWSKQLNAHTMWLLDRGAEPIQELSPAEEAVAREGARSMMVGLFNSLIKNMPEDTYLNEQQVKQLRNGL